MYYKEQRFQKAKTSTLASTHSLDLPDTGILDSIILELTAVNKSDTGAGAPHNIHHHITKVEVIGDTDKTLFSLTGEEAIAKAYRKMGRLPPFTQNEYGGKTQRQTLPILFGRRFHDGKYALDLSQWDKVELKVTNDMSSTYWSSLSMETALATIEDSIEAHPKFLKQWEYQTDKPAADQDYVRPKLPTKGLLRELMIQLDPDLTAETAAPTNDPIGDSYNWKLWFKDRALTIRDHRPKDLFRAEHLNRGLGMGRSACKPLQSTSRYTDFHWAIVTGVAISQIKENGASVTVNALEDSQNRYQILSYAGTSTFYQAIIQGLGLFHTFAIPFYTEDEESEYLNLETYKPVEIEWYGYKKDNTHRVILEKPIGQGPAEYA